MDQLFLDAVSFPVRNGTLSRNRIESGVHSWCIEIYCAESPQLDYRNWQDDRDEGEMDWLASAEPYLYAQMLPLPADSPAELIGQTYSFPQSPNDNPANWDRGKGWLFFSLYLFEHSPVYPMHVAFTEQRPQRYRASLTGIYPVGERRHNLRVEAWLDWAG